MSAFDLVMKWLLDYNNFEFEDLMHYYCIENNQDGFWYSGLRFDTFEEALNCVARREYQEE